MCDCCLWGADWVRLVRGVDPAGPLRGRYRTRIGAQRIINRAGGLEALLRRLAGEAGLAETVAPQLGDLGLIRHASAGPMLAIRTAAAWAVKSPRGYGLHPFPLLVAWSV